MLRIRSRSKMVVDVEYSGGNGEIDTSTRKDCEEEERTERRVMGGNCFYISFSAKRKS